MTIAGIVAGLKVAAGVVGAAQAMSSASQRNSQLEAQAKVEEMNAKIASNNAALEEVRRKEALQNSIRKTNLQRGAIEAQSGALGSFGGSSLDLLADVATQGALEQSSITREGTAAVVNQQNASSMAKYNASVYRAGKSGGGMAAIGSLISGFSGAAEMFLTK